MKIPIRAVKELANKYHLDTCIVFGEGEGVQHIATWGRSIDDCANAADFGNQIKEGLGWPESLHSQPSRVRKLQARIKELENEK